ncbi:MAG: hypothetical protein ACYSUX_17645 [Planctomycetota bacterium]|jgi:hypothetical protein
MKKIAAISAGCIVLISGLFLLFGNSSGQDTPIPESPPSKSPVKVEISKEAPVELPFADTTEPAADDDFPITKEQFESLTKEGKNQILEEFVTGFWEKELGISDETNAEEKSLSLEIFNRPYMRTLTEREYLQLSPEDRERADAEIGENCREIRSYVLDVVAEAESLVADKEYVNAEAHLVYILEMGRELGANKEGLLLTRAMGISCKGRALKELVKLYTQTGDNSRFRMAREQLSEIPEEIKEIRKAVEQSEANN